MLRFLYLSLSAYLFKKKKSEHFCLLWTVKVEYLGWVVPLHRGWRSVPRTPVLWHIPMGPNLALRYWKMGHVILVFHCDVTLLSQEVRLLNWALSVNQWKGTAELSMLHLLNIYTCLFKEHLIWMSFSVWLYAFTREFLVWSLKTWPLCHYYIGWVIFKW